MSATTTHETVFITRRFSGPPGSGNGGYVSGLLARRVGRSAQVTLRRPTPVDTLLQLRTSTDEQGPVWRLERDGEVLAEARRARPEIRVPFAPSFESASAASEAARGRPHPFPDCFVCGHGRAEGDGLRLLPGPLPWPGAVAAPWIPEASLAIGSGRVLSRYVWSALDCPGAFAAMGDDPRPMLLARITGRVTGSIRVGERCVVLGWQIAANGRKHEVGTALFDRRGGLCAVTHQLWIEPRPKAADEPAQERAA